MAGRTGVQRVVLLPTAGAAPGPRVPRPAVVLTAPDATARERATALGLPVVVRQELAPAPPGEGPEARSHRLDAVVRGHAVADRWRDLVVVADPATLRDVATGLCDLPEATRWSDADEVVTVGLPRGPRPVRVQTALVGAALVCLLTLVLAGRVHPLLPPLATAVAGVLLLPWPRTRHAGRTALAAAGLAAVLVFLGVAGAGRFPVE